MIELLSASDIDIVFQVGSKKYKASFEHKMKSGLIRPKSISSFDVNIFSLVNEVTKSKDETIAAKNYTIQLMESMLQKQPSA